MIENIFVSESIYVNNHKEWFHPVFNPDDPNGKILSDTDKRSMIEKKAAESGIIPLYEIFNPPKLIIKKCKKNAIFLFSRKYAKMNATVVP